MNRNLFKGLKRDSMVRIYADEALTGLSKKLD